MANLLHIDASVRRGRSLSRALSAALVAEWTRHRPEDPILHRDLGRHPPPLVDEAWIVACFTPEDQRTPAMAETLRLSDTLVAEVDWADVIVMGTPMYNYGMPAGLKAWFDQVIRIDQTFDFDLARGDFPLAPLLSGKTLVLLTASGEFGFAPGGIRAGWNHLDPHVRTCARYLGVAPDAVHHVAIEYQEFGGERHEHSIRDAHAALPNLVKTLQQAIA